MAARDWIPPASNADQGLHDWALRMWRRIDRDNNGSISKQELDCQEFHTIMRAILIPDDGVGMGGPAYARAEMDMDQAIHFALRKADLNQDGKLSFEEFKSLILILRQPQLAIHTANLIFALFDIDRDQWIDEYEFRQIYRFFLGHNPTEAEFQEEWARLDSEDRGRVNRSDYTRWMQTSRNPVFRQHAPQPMSEVMSGSADPHLLKRGDLGMSGSPSSTPAPRRAETAPPWRPWHSYSNMCWAQVRQGKQQVGVDASQQHQGQAAASRARSSGQGVKTSYVMHAAPSRSEGRQYLHSGDLRMSRSAGSLYPEAEDRPRWRHPHTANPNWPDKHGNPRRPKGMRGYLSKPQTMSDLQSHFIENPGFDDHLRRLQQPDPKFKSKYSTDRIEVSISPELLPGRSKLKHGRMRDPKTKQKQYWEDNWQSPPQLKDKYVSGTLDFRCPGKPPRYMYVDEYEDD